MIQGPLPTLAPSGLTLAMTAVAPGVLLFSFSAVKKICSWTWAAASGVGGGLVVAINMVGHTSGNVVLLDYLSIPGMGVSTGVRDLVAIIDPKLLLDPRDTQVDIYAQSSSAPGASALGLGMLVS